LGWNNDGFPIPILPGSTKGAYRLFAKNAVPIFKDHGTAGTGWSTPSTYHFNVPSINAAVPKITGGGGTVTMGPHEAPRGMHIVMGTDPQGAAFALVSGK
jgi:predicted enzyme related to lactoylglutathione lyase